MGLFDKLKRGKANPKLQGESIAFYGVSYAIQFEVLFNSIFMKLGIDDEGIGENFSDGFSALLSLVDVQIDFKWLEKCFNDRADKNSYGQGDIHVFFNNEKNEFIMLDLYHGTTDQSDMICLGVNVNTSKEDKAKEIMMDIYSAIPSITRSEFCEHRNNELLHEIDSSKFPRKCESYNQNIFYH